MIFLRELVIVVSFFLETRNDGKSDRVVSKFDRSPAPVTRNPSRRVS